MRPSCSNHVFESYGNLASDEVGAAIATVAMGEAIEIDAEDNQPS